MSLETNSFEFGEFLLDTREKVLLRNHKPLSITPKAFQLLLVLVKNHGHLVEKAELMKTVWADSFVEESNLTYTMRLLRVVLDDSRHNPRFIETVPRRGYRFIAEVKEISQEAELKTGAARAVFQKNEVSAVISPKTGRFLIPILTVAVLFVGAIAIGSWYARRKIFETSAPILSAPFALEKLSTNGKVLQAVISSDGKNIIYINGNRGNKQSIWLKQLDSGNNIEIIPPSDDLYLGLALSPNGDFLYFARKPKYAEGQADIYRISVFGGIPTKIVGESQGWISISPDGGKVSFARCSYLEEENCSLWIADSADGKNERKLASRPRPFRIADNRFAPDGKSIAFAVGQSRNQANEFGLAEVDIESEEERELSGEKFFNIKSLAWLPDKSGLLITASKIPNKNFIIWQVSPTGKATPLTKDSEVYSVLSLDKSANVLVSTQIKQDFRLHLYQTEKSSAAPKVLADAETVAFASNESIIFSSLMTGNDEIWSINADGSGQKQLTNNTADDYAPVVSPNNSSIFFASNRTGKVHVWRMNGDGSNQMQVTFKEGGFPRLVSSDGKWVYFHHGLDRTLWRVATEGGKEQLVLGKKTHGFAVSPDGSQAAFSEKQGEENVLTVISLADGQPIKTFKFAAPKSNLIKLIWSAEGKYLAYILADGEYQNNTLWFQPLDQISPQRIADLGNEEIFGDGFALSPDGKSFAVAQGGWRSDAVLLKGLR